MGKKKVIVRNVVDGTRCEAFLDEDTDEVVNHRGEAYDWRRWQVIEDTRTVWKKIFLAAGLVTVLLGLALMNLGS